MAKGINLQNLDSKNENFINYNKSLEWTKNFIHNLC